MHVTTVRMKDGRVYEGPIHKFRPEEGWLSLMQLVSVVPSRVLGLRALHVAEVDPLRGRLVRPLARARRQGWDGA